MTIPPRPSRLPRRLFRPLASVLLAAAAILPAAAAEGGDNDFPVADQVKALLAEGVREFRTGRYEAASLKLQAALKLDPDNRLLYEFYLATGDALVVRMQERDQLDDVMKDLLRRARIYQRQLRRDQGYIDILIGKLAASPEERVVATAELAAIGPWAVPRLVECLVDGPDEEKRTNARTVLTRMGDRAVIPLYTALRSADARQRHSVAMILADIGDARALPALRRLQETGQADEAVDTAVQVIATRNRIAQVPAARDLHLAEALRYFRSGSEVRDEMTSAESLVWRWQETDGKAGLVPVRSARYAWNELIGEELVFDGLATWPQDPAWHPILAAILAAQEAEAITRQRMAKEATAADPLPDEMAEALAERVTALAEAAHRVRMTGAASLLRGAQQALAAGRPEVAVRVFRILQDRDLARAEVYLPKGAIDPQSPGSVLLSSLDAKDRMVRFEAAITLAHLDPAMSFPGAEKVVPVLAEALGEWGMRVVLVVEADYRQRNAARERLRSKGYIVVTAADGFEAMQRLAEAPAKDAVLIAADLSPSLRDEHGVLIDAPEQRATTLIGKLAADKRLNGRPILVALPDDPARAAKLQGDFGALPAGASFVAKPYDAGEMHAAIDQVLTANAPPDMNREDSEDIALRSAIALQQPDTMRSGFKLAQAGQALVATLDARADPLRIESLRALGKAARGAAGPELAALAKRVVDAYAAQDAELEARPAVRSAFLYALGMLDPGLEVSRAVVSKALTNADAGVRAAAADAVGHATGVPAESLAGFERDLRLDLRAPGAGTEP